MGFLSQFFVNGGMVTAPILTGLVASPIIIHLINRMRFRKVRFAAMEFLLQAEQRNRRRLLLEQLLLLLLRILIMLALFALIARLIMDPRLTVFGGEGKAHHFVVLDDSASMKNRWGDTTSFEEAKKVILELVQEGAKRPQTQKFSMVLLSKPNDFLFSQVDVSDELFRDLQEKLENLEPSFQRPDLQAGVEAAGKHLLKEEATIKHLYVFSDFRQTDWQGKEALGDVMAGLEEDGVSINLVQSVEQALPNVGITTLDGDLHSAAVGVPVRLRIGVTNFGDQVMENVSVTVVQDGDKLPLSVTFPKVAPGKEEVQNKDITFNTEGLHQVRVEVEEDSLSADNARYLSINIPKQNYVLIVTNDTLSDAAFALETALAPQLELTGIATNVIQPDFLEQELQERGSQFRAIYMLNIPDVPEKARPLLESYVDGGGGLVWFLGDKIRPAEYNELAGYAPNETGELVREQESLFPVLLGQAPASMDTDPTIQSPDLTFKSHPVFDDIFKKANRLVSELRITGYMPVAEEWVQDDLKRKDNVTTVGYTREGDPVVFEHRYGKGQVMTFLFSAGPPWTNLIELGGLYVPIVQKLQQYVAKPDEEKHVHQIGEKLELTFRTLDYEQTINWLHPRLGPDPIDMKNPPKESAKPEDTEAAESPTSPKEETEKTGEETAPPVAVDTSLWWTEYDKLSDPGIYHYKVLLKDARQEGNLASEWEFAVNVAPEEGNMSLATEDQIREHLGEESRVAFHKYGETGFIGTGTDPGQEVRKYLMYFLLFLFLAEQALAYRLSYHPEVAEAAA